MFIGPYEHHSNELPWRESIADVVMIREDREGHIDLAVLREELERYADRPLKIGSFSAASNVTGIVSDTRGISRLLHEHGALSFFDFAAAAPYVAIEMDPDGDPLAAKDAVFISPHKFIGGPGTPGVLVARRELFRNRVPSVPGGGTVAYVNPVEHVYLADIEHREEGGTPAIVESIRAGLVFGLKAAVGAEAIREREEAFIRRALRSLGGQPQHRDPGQPPGRAAVDRLVRGARTEGRYLHHNFVVALLNDLFGIQSRGGCSCAGPYGHRLLGIDLETSHEFEREISRGCEGIKPGWVRVNFNYFISEAVFEFILDAVDLVATEGWRLLADYEFLPATGLWRHRDGTPEPPLSLRDIRYEDGVMTWPSHRHQRAGVAARRVRHGGACGSWPCRRGRSRRPRSRPEAWGRTSRPCAGSCCPRTSPPRLPEVPGSRASRGRGRRMAGHGGRRRWLGSPRSSGWISGRARRRRRSSGWTDGCWGWDAAPTRRTSVRTGGPSRILATGGPRWRRRCARWRASSRGADVLAICAVGQGPTLVAVDAAARPVRPALSPGRTGEPGPGGTGCCRGWPGWPARIPSGAARARWLLASWDAVGLWLTGEAVTTVQAHEAVPSPEALAAAGVARRRDRAGTRLRVAAGVAARRRRPTALGLAAGHPGDRGRQRRDGVDAGRRAPRAGRRRGHRRHVGRDRGSMPTGR